MLARASLGKEYSIKSATKISSKPARANEQFSTEPQHPEHEFTAPKFSWSIGNVSVTAPKDGDGTGSSHDGGPAPATRRFARPPWPIQAKLEVGAVDDPLEREADRVAEQVMRMPEPSAPVDSTARDSSARLERPTTSLRVQRKCSCGGSCDKCKTENPMANTRRCNASPLSHRVWQSVHRRRAQE